MTLSCFPIEMSSEHFDQTRSDCQCSLLLKIVGAAVHCLAVEESQQLSGKAGKDWRPLQVLLPCGSI